LAASASRPTEPMVSARRGVAAMPWRHPANHNNPRRPACWRL
jgi:hypothetical protein